MRPVLRVLHTVRYRVGQFLQACFGVVAEDELELALSALPQRARSLFRRQARHDQRHALAVYRAVVAAGGTRPELLQAALLHDVGKGGGGAPLWVRGATVVLERLAPYYAARLGQGPAEGWRRPFVAHAQHAEEGARRAEEAGCPPLTVSLIRCHQEPVAEVRTEEDDLLAALQAADGRS